MKLYHYITILSLVLSVSVQGMETNLANVVEDEEVGRPWMISPLFVMNPAFGNGIGEAF
jgi:hypothetical protein